ncbi:putative ABC transporter ATP-binding protein [Maioricimonas rarisocia]|uniref:Putative ABC transporter ATP-binding protein n=1 Tax=Maioricimonas rarisocia TaxID=2528026 RepID=A0A517Z0L9_9PLAN|nr:AAA family ATPase [Maioricimonas rarisocia]QDU36005.1 putative ABC transporter ATP-binding protein [Maioricimonas rarisocia]
MRVTQITQLKNHGIFQDYTWPSDLPDFKQFNLIYGWNGTGKSTLGKLFRSLEKRENVTRGVVRLRVDNNEIDGGSFAETHVPIRVFNKHFVTENVFTSTNEMTPIYVVGKENIDKQKELDDKRIQLTSLSSDIQSATTAATNAEKVLDTHCKALAKRIKDALGAQGNRYSSYDKRPARKLLERLAAQTATDATAMDAGSTESLLQKVRQPPMPRIDHAVVDLPDIGELQNEVTDLLSRRVVSEVIASLANDAELSHWTSNGLHLHQEKSSKSCLFCGQRLPPERLAQLEAHFSDSLQTLSGEINSCIELLQDTIAECDAYQPPKKAEFYAHMRSNYDTIFEGVTRHLNHTRATLAAIVDVLNAKKSNPFTSPQLPALSAARESPDIDALEKLIDAHNDACEHFDESVQDALQELERRYAVEELEEFKQLRDEAAAAAEERESLKTRYSTITADINALAKDILDHLEPAEHLNDDLRAYLGHDDLQLEVAETGYRITRRDEVATSLSEGERTAIALLYFLRSLTGKDFDKAHGIVVLDDPVSSLDSNALFNAFAFIKQHCKVPGQLFILTHNYGFFREVREWMTNTHSPIKKKSALYMLAARRTSIGRRSEIAKLDDLLRRHNSEYHFLFSQIYRLSQQDVSRGLEYYVSAPTLARRVLETFLSFRVPDQSSLYKKMYALDCEEALRTRIYRFVNAHSHKDAIGDHEDDLTILSETPSVMKDVIRFMTAVDKEHCDRMIRCCNA